MLLIYKLDHVYLTMQGMIWQCIIVTSFASERKQTIHRVVRDNRFSVIRDTLNCSGLRYLVHVHVMFRIKTGYMIPDAII